MKYLYLISFVLLLNSCSDMQIESRDRMLKVEKEEHISDLSTLSQDVAHYTEGLKTMPSYSQDEFERLYFRVWNIKKSALTLEDAMWADRAYKPYYTYGENLQRLKSSFYDALLENSNYKNYLSLNQKAVTLKLLNIRAMPTIEPVLYDPSKAGEGFPFDYLQNSTIAANKPILISHYSKDKKWAFIESSFTYGWVKSADIAPIDDAYTKLWRHAQQIFITKEGVPIYSEDGEFLFQSRVGMMLALIEEDESSFTVLTVGKYKNSQTLFFKSKIAKDIAHKGILDFNATSINKIINEISKTNYGWGGIYGQRDCSATLRDFFAPFGLWLPRNSFQQSVSGERVMLDKLSRAEKIKTIRENAIPFRTLLYRRGHIALYVGQENNESIIFQNVWGVKTMKDGVEGRFIIGRAIFSTLEVGKNLQNFDKNSSMLLKLRSMTRL